MFRIPAEPAQLVGHTSTPQYMATRVAPRIWSHTMRNLLAWLGVLAARPRCAPPSGSGPRPTRPHPKGHTNHACGGGATNCITLRLGLSSALAGFGGFSPPPSPAPGVDHWAFIATEARDVVPLATGIVQFRLGALLIRMLADTTSASQRNLASTVCFKYEFQRRHVSMAPHLGPPPKQLRPRRHTT